MIKKSSVLIVLILAIIQVFGQFSEEYNQYKKLYPDDDKIRLVTETNVLIEVVKGELVITSNYQEEDLYLNAKANFYSEESISYSTFFEASNLKASSFLFEKGKYKESKVKEFKHKDELSGAVFYDDSKSINFIYSNLKEGSKTKLSYDEKVNDPHFLSGFYFQDFYPVIKSVYSITANKNIELTFKKFNTDTLNIEFTKQEKGNNIIYKWVTKNVGKYESESGSTNFRNEIGHMIPYISSYKVNNEKVDLLTGVDGLYNWYYSLIKDVNKLTPDTALVNLVHSLIDDKDTELEKVKAIYYWAQKNVKYVAFEYALGGFVPRNANDIYSKKYGDCKDNSSIMQEMLAIAEIKTSLTWIGTRKIPYTYAEVPTPASDNHMILTYLDGDTPYFLDATGRYYQFGLPSSFIQGKEALIAIDSANYLIKEVPVMTAAYNFLTDTVRLTIDQQNLNGNGRVIMNGYQKIDYYNFLENQDTPEKIKGFYSRNFRKGNNKFLITDYKETNKYDYEKDFIVDYDFGISNYIRGNEDEKYVNLNLSKYISNYKIKDDQHLDKEFKYRNYSVYANVLTIPEGYKVTYIPENVSIENEEYIAHINYSQNGNKITYVYDITLNFLVIKKDKHEAFNSFIKKLEKAFKESIVLKKE